MVPPIIFYMLIHFGQAGYVLTFLPALVILLSHVLAWVVAAGSERPRRPHWRWALPTATLLPPVLINTRFFLGAPPLPRGFNNRRGGGGVGRRCGGPAGAPSLPSPAPARRGSPPAPPPSGRPGDRTRPDPRRGGRRARARRRGLPLEDPPDRRLDRRRRVSARRLVDPHAVRPQPGRGSRLRLQPGRAGVGVDGPAVDPPARRRLHGVRPPSGPGP